VPPHTGSASHSLPCRQRGHIFSLGTKSLLCGAPHNSEEYFIAFHLDAKNQVIGYQVVSHGTLTASLVHPREVFKAALLSNANAIIVAHNHPAGSLSPSQEDLSTTETLIKAGDLLGVKVMDHIIVGAVGLNSLRDTRSHLWA
jgi:DNA repair protein RadC